MRSTVTNTVAAMLLLAAMALPASAEQYTGLVHPNREVTLSMGVGGVVSKLNVRPGQGVRANQVLLVLDDRMQAIEVSRREVVLHDNSELNAAQDRVRALKIMYDDTKQVFDSTGSISRDEMSKLDIEYSTARGRLEQLVQQKRREKLEYDLARQERDLRDLTAPVAGIITRIEPKVGEWAKPGETMMVLVDAANCYLTVNVPLRAVPDLKVGATLPVRFEASASAPAVTGKVSFVSSVADAASGLVEVRLTFANPGLKIRPGIKGMIELGAAAGSKAAAPAPVKR